MRHRITILFLFGTLGAIGCSASEPAYQSCTVADVHDGDTLTAHCDNGTERLRVSSIDAPELRQTYGYEARRFAARLLAWGSRVRMQAIETDKYGRTVARIQLADGRDFAQEMVKAGWAWHYVKYSRDPELQQIEASARQLRAGLWTSPNPEPPSAWRSRRKHSQRLYARRSEPRSQRRSLPR